MRIAFLVTEFPSLSETFILNQVTGLLDLGHEVDILAHTDSLAEKEHPQVGAYGLRGRTRYPDLPTGKARRIRTAGGAFARGIGRNPGAVGASLNPLRFGRDALSLRLLHWVSLFLEYPAHDILHCHFGPNGVLGDQLRETGAVPGRIVTSFYGNDVSAYVRRFGREVYRGLFLRGDLFLPIHGEMKETLAGLGCPEERIRVHHVGIEPEPGGAPVRRGRPRLLSVARLVEKKGIEYGLRAMARVREEFPDLEYVIVGDGPLRESIEALARELGIADRVRLAGWMNREELGRTLEESTILIAPSLTGADGDREGTPVAIMDAMAHGLPVIASRHGGIPEVVVDGETGLLVPEGDTDALAVRLRELLTDPDRRERMGRAGRERIRTEFNTRVQTARLVEHYTRLLEGPSRLE